MFSFVHQHTVLYNMSSTAWICAVKWGAGGRCSTPLQMQNNLSGLVLVKYG